MNQNGRMEGGREGCIGIAQRIRLPSFSFRGSRSAALELAWRALGLLIADSVMESRFLDRDEFEKLFDVIVEALEVLNDAKPLAKKASREEAVGQKTTVVSLAVPKGAQQAPEKE